MTIRSLSRCWIGGVLIAASFGGQPAVFGQTGESKLITDSVLLKPWPGPYGGVPPWRSIDSDEFLPAFDAAIELSWKDIEAIANNPEPPSFENTIVAFEQAGPALTRVANLFGVYTSGDANLSPGLIEAPASACPHALQNLWPGAFEAPH